MYYQTRSAAWPLLSLSCGDVFSNPIYPLFYPDYCITYAASYNSGLGHLVFRYALALFDVENRVIPQERYLFFRLSVLLYVKPVPVNDRCCLCSLLDAAAQLSALPERKPVG